jgi:dihydrodipicolinate synthase/N-acetylneuraminate lyase
MQLPGAVGAIKNSTSSLAAFVRTFFALGDRLRICGLGEDELSTTLLLHHGGDGTIGGGGALGRDHPGYFNHLWSGDLETSQACGERDKRFVEFSMYPDFSPKFASVQAVESRRHGRARSRAGARVTPIRTTVGPRHPVISVEHPETKEARAWHAS